MSLIWKSKTIYDIFKQQRYKQQRYTHKSIAPRFACLSVCDNYSFFNLTELFEEFSEALVSCVVGQATNKNFGECCILLGDWWRHVEGVCVR